MFAEQRPRLCNTDEAYGIVTRHYLFAATVPQRGDDDLRYLSTSGCLDQLQSVKAAGKND